MRFFKLGVLMMQLWICNAKRVNEICNCETKEIKEEILELHGVLEKLKIEVAMEQAELEEIKNTRMEIEMVTNQPKQLRRRKRNSIGTASAAECCTAVSILDLRDFKECVHNVSS